MNFTSDELNLNDNFPIQVNPYSTTRPHAFRSKGHFESAYNINELDYHSSIKSEFNS